MPWEAVAKHGVAIFSLALLVWFCHDLTGRLLDIQIQQAEILRNIDGRLVELTTMLKEHKTYASNNKEHTP
jgi:hypothetical protein